MVRALGNGIMFSEDPSLLKYAINERVELILEIRYFYIYHLHLEHNDDFIYPHIIFHHNYQLASFSASFLFYQLATRSSTPEELKVYGHLSPPVGPRASTNMQ